MSTRGSVRLPAEWEPQAGVMLTWPHAATDWADELQQVLPVFAEIDARRPSGEKWTRVCSVSAAADDGDPPLLLSAGEPLHGLRDRGEGVRAAPPFGKPLACCLDSRCC